MDESSRWPTGSKRQQESVSSYISSGIEQGATLVAGGEGVPDGLESDFSKPTRFADVTPDRPDSERRFSVLFYASPSPQRRGREL